MSLGMKFSFFVVGLLLLVCNGWAENIAVIVHKKCPLDTIDQSDVRSLFLGKLHTFPGTDLSAVPLDQAKSSRTRRNFYISIANKTPSKMTTFWARNLFTGKGKTPSVIGDGTAVKKKVQESIHHIGYIDKGLVDGSVKVLLYVDTN